MAFSFLYLAVRALQGALVRSRRGLHVKDIELLVLRHELKWTIARFTRPTDGPATGNVRAGFLGRDKLGAAAITRADIATFLLDQLEDTRFIRAGPPSATDPTGKGPEQ
jgi:NAD(P)H-binding